MRSLATYGTGSGFRGSGKGCQAVGGGRGGLTSAKKCFYGHLQRVP